MRSGDVALNPISLLCCALAPCPAFLTLTPPLTAPLQLQSRRGYFLDDVRDLFFTAAGFGSLFRYSNCLS